MLSLGRAAVLGGADTESSDDVVVEVADRERRHVRPTAADAVKACI